MRYESELKKLRVIILELTGIYLYIVGEKRADYLSVTEDPDYRYDQIVLKIKKLIREFGEFVLEMKINKFELSEMFEATDFLEAGRRNEYYNKYYNKDTVFYYCSHKKFEMAVANLHHVGKKYTVHEVSQTRKNIKNITMEKL